MDLEYGNGMDILKNEVQNLVQIVQAFSYELTVLQDFMEAQFGSSYESFRRKHSHATVTDTDGKVISARPVGKSNLKSQNEGRSDGENDEYNRIKRKIDEISFSVVDGERSPEASDFEDPLGDLPSVKQKTDFQSCGEKIEGAASSTASKQPPSNSKNLGKGRRAASIWKKFQISYLPDGKKLAQCRICLKCVSSKADRLANHYKKCSRLPEESDDFEMSVKTLELEKLTATSILHKKKKRESSTSNSSGPLSGGRRMDPVWDYFTVVDDPETGKKSSACKRCGAKVSSKVDRVRKHFIICEELDGDMESDDANDASKMTEKNPRVQF